MKKKSRPEAAKAELLRSLAQAHEADHAILKALGIKHPHTPFLSVVEMLDHLKASHAEESKKEKS